MKYWRKGGECRSAYCAPNHKTMISIASLNRKRILVILHDMTTQHQVSIYSTPSCAYCKLAKEHFAKNSIAYTEYNVAADITKRQEMLDKSHQFGVPVIDIDGKIVIGFDKPKINELLGL